jgi:hypothetical protein
MKPKERGEVHSFNLLRPQEDAATPIDDRIQHIALTRATQPLAFANENVRRRRETKCVNGTDECVRAKANANANAMERETNRATVAGTDFFGFSKGERIPTIAISVKCA